MSSVWEANRSAVERAKKTTAPREQKAKQQNHEENHQLFVAHFVLYWACVVYWFNGCQLCYEGKALYNELHTVRLCIDSWTPGNRFYTKIIVRCTVCLSLSISFMFFDLCTSDKGFARVFWYCNRLEYTNRLCLFGCVASKFTFVWGWTHFSAPKNTKFKWIT